MISRQTRLLVCLRQQLLDRKQCAKCRLQRSDGWHMKIRTRTLLKVDSGSLVQRVNILDRHAQLLCHPRDYLVHAHH